VKSPDCCGVVTLKRKPSTAVDPERHHAQPFSAAEWIYTRISNWSPGAVVRQ